MTAKIYTKTGDGGLTGLVDGSRVEKDHPRVETYGTLDELNSWIGELRGQIRDTIAAKPGKETSAKLLDARLQQVQEELFVMGSQIACSSDKIRSQLPALSADATLFLEKDIDAMQALLPALTNFILPDGEAPSRAAHLARTVCRRAERLCAALARASADNLAQGAANIEIQSLQYLNRLSDYLFVVARFCQHELGKPETLWRVR